MSAIYGCVDLSGMPIEASTPDKMGKCLSKYKIDKIETLLDNNVFFACGFQFITKEAGSEDLPCVEDGIYFTADCILDNRDELIYELGCDPEIPDGKLLFIAFKKWGESFGDHVLGIFSFAVYISMDNEFHLYTDHTSSRCVYYHINEDKVYFGTLSSCITDALPDIGLCEKWMVACEDLDIAYSYLYEGLTPFENVFILPYGSGIVVKKENGTVSNKQVRYWNPLETIKEKRRFDDDECRQRFVQTHIKCVESALRTDGDIGIQLSSGLDSTAVASIAAPYLEKQHKKLYSYTSIPIKEFRDQNNGKKGYYVDDESDGVKAFCAHFPNIISTFISCEGENVWTYIDEWCDYLELPCKSLVNHIWIHDCLKDSSQKGVKVVLTGANGNNTISYGSMERNAYLLLKHGRFLEAYKQLIGYAKYMKFGKKRYLKYFFGELKASKEDTYINFDEKGFRKDLAEKYNTHHDWEELFRSQGTLMKTKKQFRNSVISSHIFQLMGVINTKEGLYHGLVLRDPTMDKRMLELCLELPYKCFAWNGVERRLVREYLSDYVPEEIRLDVRHRGRQSGDAALRLNRFKYPGRGEAYERLSDRLIKYYNLDEVVENMKKDAVDEDLDWRAKVMACSIFLDNIGKIE